MSNLSKMAELAQRILKKDTEYSKNKVIISDLFKQSSDIGLRLRVVDSIYSTQMNKRLFGFEDIASKISKSFNGEGDKAIREEISSILSGKDSIRIKELLHGTYGRSKLGKEGSRATSLVSKYLYFVNNFDFPIYDSLVVESYPLINRLIKGPREKLNEENFIERLVRLKKDSGVDTFDKLDNLLWLTGKIKKGSLSLILNKEKYGRFIEILGEKEIYSKIRKDGRNTSDSKKVDKAISGLMLDRKKLVLLEKKKVFSSELKEFSLYVMKL